MATSALTGFSAKPLSLLHQRGFPSNCKPLIFLTGYAHPAQPVCMTEQTQSDSACLSPLSYKDPTGAGLRNCRFSKDACEPLVIARHLYQPGTGFSPGRIHNGERYVSEVPNVYHHQWLLTSIRTECNVSVCESRVSLLPPQLAVQQ